MASRTVSSAVASRPQEGRAPPSIQPKGWELDATVRREGIRMRMGGRQEPTSSEGSPGPPLDPYTQTIHIVRAKQGYISYIKLFYKIYFIIIILTKALRHREV